MRKCNACEKNQSKLTIRIKLQWEILLLEISRNVAQSSGINQFWKEGIFLTGENNQDS